MPAGYHEAPLHALALSPSMLAHLLDVYREVISKAISAGELRCHRPPSRVTEQPGTLRRVLVRDALRWIRRNWKETQP
jgi:hypothetical protein